MIELLSLKRNDISREFKDIIGENISSHLDKLKSEVHLIEDDIKQAVTEMSKFLTSLNVGDQLERSPLDILTPTP